VGKELFSALIITDLTTMIGKVATWDDSPNGEWGSFPSGHTASTFALASVMHEEYGWLAGLPLYGLGTLVGIHRLDDDEHYLSDVVFGAVLGVVVGHSVARDEPLELFGGMVLPYADPYNGGAGVAWVKSLP
jgi:membrane-associated phospholipid phosphatase